MSYQMTLLIFKLWRFMVKMKFFIILYGKASFVSNSFNYNINKLKINSANMLTFIIANKWSFF